MPTKVAESILNQTQSIFCREMSHHLTPREQQLAAGALITALTMGLVLFRSSPFRRRGSHSNQTNSHPQPQHAVVVSGKNGSSTGGNGTKRFQLYMNPLCPFVHRVRIVINELHATDMFSFTPIPLKAELARARYLNDFPAWSKSIGMTTVHDLQELKDWFMTNVNMGGDVPIVIDHDASSTGLLLKESDVISEYLYLTLNHTRGVDLDLFPSSSFLPEDVVRFRFAMKTFPSSAFYTVLRNQDPAKDADMFKSLREDLGKFLSHMSPTGPYYVGPKFTFADIYCVPHVQRFSALLKHYRGFDLFAPCEEYDAKRFKSWYTAVSSRPSVQKTSATSDETFRLYEGEANDNKLDENGFYGRGRSL